MMLYYHRILVSLFIYRRSRWAHKNYVWTVHIVMRLGSVFTVKAVKGSVRKPYINVVTLQTVSQRMQSVVAVLKGN